MNSNQQPADETAKDNEWTYTSGELLGGNEHNTPSPEAFSNTDTSAPLLSWTASEFIENDKSAKWYLALGGAALGISILVYIFTRQILSIVLVLVMAIVFGIYGSAKPRVLSYAVTKQGLTIDKKSHPYSTIKSFSVINEEGMPYIQVLFQKRLSIPINIYAAPEEIDVIAEAIGQFVPYDQKKRDIADKLSSKIRF